jgi:hypothetical protein
MQARITRFKMKPDHVEAARELMESLRGDILGVPGMRQFVSAMNSDGSQATSSRWSTMALRRHPRASIGSARYGASFRIIWRRCQGRKYSTWRRIG